MLLRLHMGIVGFINFQRYYFVENVGSRYENMKYEELSKGIFRLSDGWMWMAYELTVMGILSCLSED